MSLAVRHTCEFCRTEFLHRLSGTRFGTSSCPGCGRSTTPPAPRPESLRPASEYFPGGVRLDRASDTSFVVSEVKLEPMRMPNLRIFEMESFTPTRDPNMHRMFDYGRPPVHPDVAAIDKAMREHPFTQEYMGEFPEPEPVCTCGHVASAHREVPRNLKRRYGHFSCRGDGPADCNCTLYTEKT